MKTTKLGDVCEIITRGIAPKYTEDKRRGVIVLNQRCIRSGEIDFRLSRLHDAEIKPISRTKRLKSGDILVNSTGQGTLGRSAIIESVPSGTMTVDSHITIIRPRPDIFDSRYFAYIVNRSEPAFIEMATGTSGQTELPRALLSEHLITYAESLSEQKDIVARLDRSLAQINKAEEFLRKNIANVADLQKSILAEAFRFDNDTHTHQLGDLFNFIRGPFGGSLTKSMFKMSGYAVYEQRQAIHNDFDNFRYFIDDKKFDEMKRFSVSVGDLLMSCSGTMGKISIVPNGSPKGIINQALLKMTPNSKVNTGFMMYWFNSELFTKLIEENSGGSAIKNVSSVKILKNLQIELPSLATQQQVVQELDLEFAKINKIKRLYTEKLTKITELRKSTLAEAFTL